MTEDEAKKKWCPMARVYASCGSSEVPQFGTALAATSYNRGSKDKALCIASICMMWRWEVCPEYAAKMKEEHDNTSIEVSGYCGLGGRTMTDREKELLVKLKCYFTADFMGIADGHSGGCETCGYGGTSVASLEAIHQAIDNFIKQEEGSIP